jgi:hypothetical protein
MIDGVHFLLFSADPEADQAVLDRILGTRSVPAEPGRIIMALPPAEIATHAPSGTLTHRHADRDLLGLVLYLTCEDLVATLEELTALGVDHTAVADAEFGVSTAIILPSGGQIGLYQPSHETAFEPRRSG